MATHFLFLEILDPEINALFNSITEITSGEKPTKPVHLTVRGPYNGPLSSKTIELCREEMRYDVLKIANVGRFSNPGEEVVYFQVDSPHLRNIWYKPTYKISEYGFHPHLSVYRGRDGHWADLLAKFIEGEGIELLCAEFQLTPYVTKQIPLIKDEPKIAHHFPRLITSGRIHESFISRLSALTDNYNSRNSGIQQLLL
jgi:hypothetical protein